MEVGAGGLEPMIERPRRKPSEQSGSVREAKRMDRGSSGSHIRALVLGNFSPKRPCTAQCCPGRSFSFALLLPSSSHISPASDSSAGMLQTPWPSDVPGVLWSVSEPTVPLLCSFSRCFSSFSANRIRLICFCNALANGWRTFAGPRREATAGSCQKSRRVCDLEDFDFLRLEIF
jgi:hypothetical protein